MDYLRERGYEHYEISSFARPGMRSQHNHAYWFHTNYIGFGPSAHSFWWTGLHASRRNNIPNLNRFEALMKQGVAPLADRESMSRAQQPNEAMMLRRRPAAALDPTELHVRSR